MKKYNNSQLIEGLRARDEEVTEFIFKRYKPCIVHLITRYGGTLYDVEDIFQDGLLRLIEMVDDKDFNATASLSTILYAICDKLWRLNLEKKRVAKNYFVRKPDEDEFSEIDIEHDRNLYESIYYGSFKKLQKDCQVILKALMKGVPVKDVALTLDYSYDYLRRKKRVCHAYLLKNIEKHQDYKLIREKEGEVKLY
ncbi:MAG: sigma factor [Candidatus Paceibacterota bacterium]